MKFLCFNERLLDIEKTADPLVLTKRLMRDIAAPKESVGSLSNDGGY